MNLQQRLEAAGVVQKDSAKGGNAETEMQLTFYLASKIII